MSFRIDETLEQKPNQAAGLYHGVFDERSSILSYTGELSECSESWVAMRPEPDDYETSSPPPQGGWGEVSISRAGNVQEIGNKFGSLHQELNLQHKRGGYGMNDHKDEPQLGLATTRQLLLELKARGEVSATIGEYPEEMGSMAMGAANLLDSLPGSMLDYRTVDA